ncbi:MAG: hypothetical protein ACLQRM_04380 [Acidimicrobiales bacterium]
MGIPARITSSGGEPNSYKELVAEIAQLRRLLEANTAELRELNDRLAEREARLAERDARVAELERLLAECSARRRRISSRLSSIISITFARHGGEQG